MHCQSDIHYALCFPEDNLPGDFDHVDNGVESLCDLAVRLDFVCFAGL